MNQQDSANPAVSVIVPVYNRRDLILRAVRSLLEQDFNHAYEIVVVDDGSTDGSAEAVENIDPRVRVVRQKNQGAAVARHTGVSAARAELVTFLDSDDIAKPNKLSVLHGAIVSNPDCVMACATAEDTAGCIKTVPVGIDKQMDGRYTVIHDPLAVLICQGAPIASAMNLITYRTIALESSSNRSRYKCSNDYDLELRLAQSGSVVYVSLSTVIYEFQPEGLSIGNGAALQAAYALCAANDVIRSIGNRGDYKDALRACTQRHGAHALVDTYARRNWSMFAEIFAMSIRYGRWWSWPRTMWWDMDTMLDTQPERMPIEMRYPTAFMRRIRNLF